MNLKPIEVLDKDAFESINNLRHNLHDMQTLLVSSKIDVSYLLANMRRSSGSDLPDLVKALEGIEVYLEKAHNHSYKMLEEFPSE